MLDPSRHDVHTGARGAPIKSCYYALTFEVSHDSHLVVDVRAERFRVGDGTFCEHDHAYPFHFIGYPTSFRSAPDPA
jgi:hypothetical protein